jgi:hypothetical protein
MTARRGKGRVFSGWTSIVQMENGEELPASPGRKPGIGIVSVEEDGLLQAVKIRRAVGASLDVLFDLPVRRFAQLIVEQILDVARHFAARGHMSGKSLHGVGTEYSGAARSASAAHRDRSSDRTAESLLENPNQAAFSAFFVESLKGTYNGQKLMRLVSRKITANSPRMIANVPEIWFVKYNTAITIARRTRMTRSAAPMFFFMNLSCER